MKKLSLVALSGALLLGLSSCSLTVKENRGMTGSQHNLIADIHPLKGEGSIYHVGEPLGVRITTRTDGYLTLLALDPSGAGTILLQNVFVPAGTTDFPRAEDKVTFTVAPPYGNERIRAIFTRVRPATGVVLGGRYDADRWNEATNSYLAPYNLADRDVQETYIRIAQPQ